MTRARAAARLAASPLVDRWGWERWKRAGLYTRLHSNLDPETHIREAADWMCRAQDHGDDRGVSYGAVFGEGFLPSYPETTGYIINTFLKLASHYGNDDYARRAKEMGRWEAAIQMDCGAVMGGMIKSEPTPAVFNTGMVLLGWADLYRRTGADEFRTAGIRAGQWLLDMQESNGHWVRGNSLFAAAAITVHNVKAAWGLAEMGAALGEKAFVEAATRNAEFAIGKQHENGWFEDCCLEDGQRPLLHTIAYTMQGLMGVGRIAGRKDLIERAARTARSLMTLMRDDGFVPGRIDRDFRGAASWCCLTGTAQTSIVWSELAAATGDPDFADAAERANRYLMARHDICNLDPTLRGAVPGSWPVWGHYGRLRVLNWATKFFTDALLERIENRVGPVPRGDTPWKRS